MEGDPPPPSSSSSDPPPPKQKSSWPSPPGILLLLLAPIAVSMIVYQLETFDPAPAPTDYSFAAPAAVPEHHDRILSASERVGDGLLLLGPEDLAYDAEEGYLYTGCGDGWIRRVGLRGEELKVEDWAYVGGRPLGLALGPRQSLVVAEPNKGLMIVKPDQTVGLLTDEAEGLKFRLTDGVDVAANGMIYFTDATYKYNFDVHGLDFLEARPHGRLMSFNPSTNTTVVLARDLYFANGVSLSPNQDSLIFCETLLRRCRRYHILGEKSGTIEKFIDNLPGFPDNIRYDGESSYWIGLASGRVFEQNVGLKYPFLRKLMFILEKFIKLPQFMSNAGVLKVSLEGQPLALYSDPGLSLVTGGFKIGKHLYYGSLVQNHINRVNISED